MQKRIGSGQVCSSPLVSNEAKRRKVLRSVWKPTSQEANDSLITVKSSLALPMRIRSAQSFDYKGKSQRIYADLIYSAPSYQVVRFVNGPNCSSLYTMLSKATKALQDSTAASEIQWQYKASNSWLELQRLSFPNTVTREQATVALSLEVEQALALEPSARQVSALPFTRKPHFRNLARRLLAVQPMKQLSELGFHRNSKASEKFSHCYRVEQCAVQIQLNGICILCQSRPVEARYSCYHCVSCTGCAFWKCCPVCDAF